MMLSSLQLCEHLRLSERHVRRITKDANIKGLKVMSYHGKRFRFELISTRATCGKSYVYSAIDLPKAGAKPRRRVPAAVVLNPAQLPLIADFKRPSAAEKLAVITFCKTSKLAYGHIAKGLICKHQVFAEKESSLETKMRRWDKAYRDGGIAALEDKRGGKDAKVDIELLKRVVFAGGTLHYTSLFFNYCYLYAQDNGLALDLRNPSADIHYVTFVRAVERLKRDDPHIAKFLAIGMDAFTYAEPSIGREWEYPNQQWEMDATVADVMVKVPIIKTSKNEGYRDYFTRAASEDYQLVRMKIVGIADNYSNAVVYGLYDQSNYYSMYSRICNKHEMIGLTAADRKALFGGFGNEIKRFTDDIRRSVSMFRKALRFAANDGVDVSAQHIAMASNTVILD